MVAFGADKILLVPLDSRPAAGQFAQMIAQMDAADVHMPPYEMLGRFTVPGDPDSILNWLETQDYKDISSIVISADMVCYGGLIASRSNDVAAPVALARMQRIADLKKVAPHIKIYVVSAIMRLAPTATRSNSAWRLRLAKFAEMRREAGFDGFRRRHRDDRLKLRCVH